jgi:ornithine cyclodeaminase/alanine dehydrogenase-like protein (mu-crystallin family)
MKTLFVGAKEVADILEMPTCIRLMRETFKAYAEGKAAFPLRRALVQPDKKGLLGMMPGFLNEEGIIGLKATSVFPGNLGTRFESHQGAVLLFDSVHGRFLSAVDAGSITAIRTAAATGVATDSLSREDSSSLALLGSGTQASTHLESILEVRKGVEEVCVWSRNADHAKIFVDRESRDPRRHGVRIRSVESAEEAVRGAAIVCTLTGAKSPILKGAWLSPGTHVNAVGASVPPYRELDTDAILRGKLFVDSRESALNEADDLRIPMQEGVVGSDHIRGEIGEVLTGRVAGRTEQGEITIFKSLGLSIEDLAAAKFVYDQASSKGLGTWVEFSGEREATG